jgi:hypothetical protein
MNKPQSYSEYSKEQTELAEQVLLEVWSRLGQYRRFLVLVGGLVPRYIVDQKKAAEQNTTHYGSMDVDLGISMAVKDLEAYHSIRETLFSLGFRQSMNERGNPQMHSFVKDINNVPVNIDFLTTEYDGPEDSLMRGVKDELRAIQVEGLGLALVNPLMIKITGKLLSGGNTEEEIRVCNFIPYIVLKALAFDNRREPKDAYDLVYVLQNAIDDPKQLAHRATEDERKAPSFLHAIETLQNHFRTIEHNGPMSYERFTAQPGNAAIAYAAVQDFLRGINELSRPK